MVVAIHCASVNVLVKAGLFIQSLCHLRASTHELGIVHTRPHDTDIVLY